VEISSTQNLFTQPLGSIPFADFIRLQNLLQHPRNPELDSTVLQSLSRLSTTFLGNNLSGKFSIECLGGILVDLWPICEGMPGTVSQPKHKTTPSPFMGRLIHEVNEGEDVATAESVLHDLQQHQSERCGSLLPSVESSTGSSIGASIKTTQNYPIDVGPFKRLRVDEFSNIAAAVEPGISPSGQDCGRQARSRFLQTHSSKSILSFGEPPNYVSVLA
jgi:hypothetical protein